MAKLKPGVQTAVSFTRSYIKQDKIDPLKVTKEGAVLFLGRMCGELPELDISQEILAFPIDEREAFLTEFKDRWEAWLKRRGSLHVGMNNRCKYCGGTGSPANPLRKVSDLKAQPGEWEHSYPCIPVEMARPK